MILDVYPWVTLPRCLVYPMTATCLTSGPKVKIACFAQVTVSNTFGIPLHLQQDFVKFRHDANSIIIDIIVKGLVGGKDGGS